MRRDAAPRSTQTPRVEPWRFFVWGGVKVDRRRAIVRLRKRGYGTGHTDARVDECEHDLRIGITHTP
ncbi:hypothetical protein UA18_01061 [Burkholderia multivorans]|uniref:Uncharacterized protein n=1 Tax=Burkholderia multivorans TaxID=87883 RepID=A0ABD7LGS5_9BURK|nr:hypothetical protein UA18_01061 [Burkholderia multivorans]SAK16849.1 hypothetical protein UA17_01320 [Burkholderia multivorans]